MPCGPNFSIFYVVLFLCNDVAFGYQIFGKYGRPIGNDDVPRIYEDKIELRGVKMNRQLAAISHIHFQFCFIENELLTNYAEDPQ